MPVEASDLNPVETMEEGILKAYNEDKSQIGDFAVWEEDTFSVLKGPYSTRLDEFWNCDTYHQYAVATTLPHQTVDNLKLWKNDILVGFKSSDTSGMAWSDLWHGDGFNYDSSHKIVVSIKHTDEKGRSSRPVYQHIFAGGDSDNGTRYFSFYPTKVGKYTVVFNRVLSAGGCAVPYEGRPNFLSYDLYFKPPDEADLPPGIDVDIDALKDTYNQFLDSQAYLEDNPTEPVEFPILVGGAVLLSIVSYLVVGYLFK